MQHWMPCSKPFLLLLLFALFHFPQSNVLASPTCTAHTYLIGLSNSPTTLSQFLRQFPFSRPPDDLCIIFLTREHHHHKFFKLANLRLLHPPTTLHTAYEIALKSANRILVADDHTFFHTTRYGTGKSDVDVVATSFNALFPIPHIIRQAPSSLSNSAAILTNYTILDRTLPLTHLYHTGGRAETSFDSLPNITGRVHDRPLITTLLPFTPDVRDAHRMIQPRFPLSMVLYPDNSTLPTKGLFHPPGSFGRLAKPVLFERPAVWLLPFDDNISGYVIQRALWESANGVLVVPGLDVWRVEESDEVVHEDDVVMEKRLKEVIKFVQEVEIPGRLKFVDEVFVCLLEGLLKRGLIERDVLLRIRAFHMTLRRRAVARLLRRRYQAESESEVETAVCVTGQMRSAAFTARNILENLGEGIVGGFEVFVVTERDDRSGAARLFNATSVRYSTTPDVHAEWINLVARSKIVHETMMTERQVGNYLKQLWDLRECERGVREREFERGRKYRWMVRIRPDVVFTRALTSRWWTGRTGRGSGSRAVVYGKRQSYYAMNDRFFAGDRMLMGRLMSCHDLFGWLLTTAKVYSRKAGDGTHMLFKKLVNSERFLGRCAAWKRVATKGVDGIEVQRVALSGGVARWREF